MGPLIILANSDSIGIKIRLPAQGTPLGIAEQHKVGSNML